MVNSEVGTSLSFGKYHDGPVTSVHSPNEFNIYMTAGGRIFALWRDDFKDRPVLWRRCHHKLTSGKFNMYQVGAALEIFSMSSLDGTKKISCSPTSSARCL